MSAMASQITSLPIVYSTVYSGEDQRKHQSPVSLAFVRGIHRWLVNSPHKGPVTRKLFPFDDVIIHTRMINAITYMHPGHGCDHGIHCSHCVLLLPHKAVIGFYCQRCRFKNDKWSVREINVTVVTCDGFRITGSLGQGHAPTTSWFL